MGRRIVIGLHPEGIILIHLTVEVDERLLKIRDQLRGLMKARGRLDDEAIRAEGQHTVHVAGLLLRIIA